ncbi:toxin-antitoxin system TumE family protein [Halovenus halobia]|uniref:toxin-antitoxin system TumE family protein n=1 Tax=Halovenus halobia TaxID=3396622 RepID=UPI003F54319D
MGSTVISKDSGTYEDGSRYEMVVTEVPQSDDYPEGIKYRFQYMAEDGRTLLRFDNFPDHPGVDRHHYHTSGGVYDDIEYTGSKDHIRKFYERMDTLRSGDQP